MLGMSSSGWRFTSFADQDTSLMQKAVQVSSQTTLTYILCWPAFLVFKKINFYMECSFQKYYVCKWNERSIIK